MESSNIGASPPNVTNVTNVINVTNATADDIALVHIEHVLYGIIMPVLSALGIVGNILNLVVLTRPNLMKIVTYTYFRAMAISDLLTMIMVIPFVMEINGSGFSSYVGLHFHAHFVLPCLNAFCGSSVLVIVAVTVERWMSICFPIQAKNLQSPIRAKLIIAAAWCISFAFYIPLCFRKHVTPFSNLSTGQIDYRIEEDTVYTHTQWYGIYGWVREAVLRLIPMVLMVALNIWMVFALRKLQNRRRRLKGGGEHKRPSTAIALTASKFSRNSSSRHSTNLAPAEKKEYRRLQEERRLVILLVGIVVMFMVCVTPAAGLLMVPLRDEQFTFSLSVFRAVANVLELTNFALNFYVYVGCSSDFRMTFSSVFCRHCPKKQPPNGDVYSTVTAQRSSAVTRKSIVNEKLSHSANSTPTLKKKRNSRAMIIAESQELLPQL